MSESPVPRVAYERPMAALRDARSLRYRVLVWWYGLGLKWTERQCRRHGDDYYAGGYMWLLRKLGWD